MDMIDMSVTLIVKAPNQQIEDQTIKCEPTWTIKKLKGYLSEVYPSKPRTEDQKLIYSGQLLSDSVILRDILRWYEGQEAHTVHLVCTPPRDSNRRGSPRPQAKMSERQNSYPPEDNSSSSSSSSSSNNSSLGTSGLENSSEGLRQRLSAGETSVPQPVTGSLPDSHLPAPDSGATWAAAMAQPYAAGYDPNNMMQQVALMHQVYAHYMTQYMQMLASGGTLPPASPPSQVGAPATPAAEQPAVPMNNQEHRNQEAANDINVVDAEEENRMNRDWLDWFYFMSRLMVLFSIVYFYSSPTRFVIVSALAIMMYLYQVGFFRIQQQQLQVARVAADNNNGPVEARRVDNNNADPNESEDTPRINEESVSEGGEAAQEPDRPSLLAVTWTFFTSFFASLIPEQPGAI